MNQDRSLAKLRPQLAQQWHPTKNGDLKPSDVTVMSGRKVWWKCSAGDDHEWKGIIAYRSKGGGCPICSNQKVVKSNSLGTVNPELAEEWHPTLNGDLTPFDVLPSSNKKIWWLCKANEEHYWEAKLNNRANGKGCPYCANQKILRSNSLGTVNPTLAEQWHPTLNGQVTPFDVAPSANKKYWWKCPNGDDHVWLTSVNHRATGTGCPKCNPVWSRAELRIYCELSALFPTTTHHAIVNGNEIDVLITELGIGIEYDGVYWHEDKQERDLAKNEAVASAIHLIRLREDGLPLLSESDITVSRKALKLSEIKQLLLVIAKLQPLSSEQRAAVSLYQQRTSWLASALYKKLYSERKSVAPEKSLQAVNPKLAAEWHPTKNDGLKPNQFASSAARKVWWQGNCGHEWQDTINHRAGGRDCPECRYVKASRTRRLRRNKGQLNLF